VRCDEKPVKTALFAALSELIFFGIFKSRLGIWYRYFKLPRYRCRYSVFCNVALFKSVRSLCVHGRPI